MCITLIVYAKQWQFKTTVKLLFLKLIHHYSKFYLYYSNPVWVLFLKKISFCNSYSNSWLDLQIIQVLHPQSVKGYKFEMNINYIGLSNSFSTCSNFYTELKSDTLDVTYLHYICFSNVLLHKHTYMVNKINLAKNEVLLWFNI